MSKRIRVKPLGWIVISCFLIFISFLILAATSPRDREKGFRWYVHKATGKDCISYRQAIYSRKLKDMLPDYIARSSASGIEKCSNRRELMKKLFRGEVVRIRDSRGFSIEDMSHSYPYLTKEGKAVIREMGRRFRKKISGTKLRGSDFRVTSMTRTTEEIRKLRKSNSNASGNSPHFHGNAFDISYVRFTARKWFVTDCDKYYLKEALAEVIWQMRAEKKCWATYEINQGCFHIVAR